MYVNGYALTINMIILKSTISLKVLSMYLLCVTAIYIYNTYIHAYIYLCCLHKIYVFYLGEDHLKCYCICKVGFVEGNAEMLPFADSSFDLYTIAFGLRNVTNKDVCMYGPVCIRMTYSMLSLY